MTSTEAVKEAGAFQETLDHLPQYYFHDKTTIYWDKGFGRCETEGGILIGEQLKDQKWGLHYYRALDTITVYCFSLPANDKYKRRRTLYSGQQFRAGGGKPMHQK